MADEDDGPDISLNENALNNGQSQGGYLYPGSSTVRGEDPADITTRRNLKLNLGNFANQNIQSIRQPTLASLGHHFQIERIRSHGFGASGKLQISPDQVYDFTSEDLCDLGEIGRGHYGTVNKMQHVISKTVMAVKGFTWILDGESFIFLSHNSEKKFKRIRSTVDEKEQSQLLMELGVVIKSSDCPYIVQFYGALFKEGDCWICMQLMSVSLDKFYKFIYGTLERSLPESILGKITVATVKALNYLKEKLKIIHRDVKPSNILLDHNGNIKLCDFGISGKLVDSIAKSRDAGCRPYMAPERIDPRQTSRGYDIRSDVWSLGITLYELTTGKFPYPKWNSVFDQLTQVVQGPAPLLDHRENGYSRDFVSFVNTCLTKDEKQRPKYNKLLEHQFIKHYEQTDIKVSEYVCSILDQMPENMEFEQSSS